MSSLTPTPTTDNSCAGLWAPGPDPAAELWDRWPATLPTELAERAYYAERKSSYAWVDGLFTRGGIPRWHRIKTCGDPCAVIRPSDGAVSWQPHWCGDRACYACARSRSRKMSRSLREAVESKPAASLYFVTLTRPRVLGETPRQAWDRQQRAWEHLRHAPAFDLVVGGVRTVEVTWSAGHVHAKHKIPGWHVHAHTLMELDLSGEGGELVACPTCEGKAMFRGKSCRTCGSKTVKATGYMPLALRSILDAWTTIVFGAPQAQCGVTLDRVNVGQLAKYLTKLWDLPKDKARELFAAANGRRVTEGFGEWRKWKRWGAVERTPHGWYPSGVPLRIIEHMDDDDLVSFFATLPGVLMSNLATRARVLGAALPKAPTEQTIAMMHIERGRAELEAALGDDDAQVQAADLRGRTIRARAALEVAVELDAAGRDRRPRGRLHIDNGGHNDFRPRIELAAMSARRVLASLLADPRPVWERIDDTPPDHLQKMAALHRELAGFARTEFRGHTLDPPPVVGAWEH